MMSDPSTPAARQKAAGPSGWRSARSPLLSRGVSHGYNPQAGRMHFLNPERSIVEG
jgi:hypothetical protein